MVQSSKPPKTDMWRLLSKFFTANIIFAIYLGFICLNPRSFVGKTTKYIFPWTRDSQCQNSFDSFAENTPNVSKNLSPNCLPNPKILGFLKKKLSLGVRSPCLHVIEISFGPSDFIWARNMCKIISLVTAPVCWGQPMLLFWILVDETQISKP